MTIDRILRSAALLTLAAAGAPALAAPRPTGTEAPARPAPADVLALPELIIAGWRDGATTEGSGSFTSDAVTVAGKAPVRRIDVPHSISVVTRRQIEDQTLTTVDEALARATGVTRISNEPSQSQYLIRGYDPQAMSDGVPVLGGLSGYQQLDTVLYDRIEVLRGPAGLLLGQGEPAGVVNFVRKRPRETFGASLATSYGSWANKRVELDLTGPLGGESGVRWRGILAGTDRDSSFRDGHGTRGLGAGMISIDLTPRTTLSLSAVRQSDLSPSFSGLPADAATRRFLRVPRDTNPYPAWARNQWTTQEYAAELEHRFGEWVLRAAYVRRLQDFAFKDAYPVTGTDPAGNAKYARRWSIWSYDREGADLSVQGPVEAFGRRHEVLLGMNAMSWSQAGRRVNYPQVDGNIFDPNAGVAEPFGPFTRGSRNLQEQWGVYGQTRLRLLDPLTLVLGGRLSSYEARSRAAAPSRGTPWETDTSVTARPSPYGALVYELTPGLNAYASYADIFLPQTDPKWPSGVIDPRVGTQYEVGLKGEALEGRLQASAALFRIDDVNRAFDDAAHPNYSVALGKARSEGVEVEVSGELLPGWQAVAGYTYARTELLRDDSRTGARLTNWLPKHSVKLWSQYDVQDGPLRGVFVGLGLVAASTTSDQGRVPVRFQPPYAVLDLQIGYAVNRTLRATLSVNNVLDTVYRTRIGGLNTYNTYGDPRNVMLTLRATF
ncbi:TonB-dependent siderophore receptor [Methylobacterium sp. WSM2598]|uniref:TonB-dependent siderophore receptor n=1 Tax=Methylobacterium sp. WSM2598 TaxID=398261 RepID=UPI00035ED792|nr:TonB-dependent siderophore receptor [Methylobacterium sp. WSM2598]